jgi:hypothetical protein
VGGKGGVKVVWGAHVVHKSGVDAEGQSAAQPLVIFKERELQGMIEAVVAMS